MIGISPDLTLSRYRVLLLCKYVTMRDIQGKGYVLFALSEYLLSAATTAY